MSVIYPASAYPRTIESGSGQRMTFIGHSADARGEWMTVESVIAPGAGPLLHSHPTQVEEVTVVGGELSYTINGGASQIARAGESVAFPPGIAHRFWNSGSAPLSLTGRISPPQRFEEFMTLLYGSMSANRGRPGLFDAAKLACEFQREATLAGMPRLLRNVVLPVIWRVGKVLGR